LRLSACDVMHMSLDQRWVNTGASGTLGMIGWIRLLGTGQ